MGDEFPRINDAGRIAWHADAEPGEGGATSEIYIAGGLPAPPALKADAAGLSQSAGGQVHFTLYGGAARAGRTYLLLGTFRGTAPGVPLPGGHATLPLNWDAFTDAVLLLANRPMFAGFVGKLNEKGLGFAQLSSGPLSPGHEGERMHFAFTLSGPFDWVSNPVEIDIMP